MEPTKSVKDPSLPATSPQTWAIFLASGYDVRGTGITKGEASALIDLSKEGHQIVDLVKDLPGAVNKKEPKASEPKTAVQETKTINQSRKRYDGTVVFRIVGDSGTGILSLPKNLAQHLQVGAHFRPEITPEGILYRPVFQENKVDPTLPDWVHKQQ